MQKYLLLLILGLSSTSFSQVTSVEAFKDSIAPFGLVYEHPEKYTPVAYKENKDVFYQFAMTNKRKSVEVRYSYTDLSYYVKEYEESLKDTNRSFIDPNVLQRSMIFATCMNLSGGTMPEVGYFPEKSVKNEFGADSGGTVMLELNSEFGQGWKYCQIVFLHLDNVCDVYIFFLTNKIKKHLDLVMETFYALRFK